MCRGVSRLSGLPLFVGWFVWVSNPVAVAIVWFNHVYVYLATGPLLLCSLGGAVALCVNCWGGGGKREIIYLSLHCHHQNDSCIKVGSDESRFNVS